MKTRKQLGSTSEDDQSTIKEDIPLADRRPKVSPVDSSKSATNRPLDMGNPVPPRVGSMDHWPAESRIFESGLHPPSMSLTRFNTASTTIVPPAASPAANDSNVEDASRESVTSSRPRHPLRKPLRFWLIFASIMAVTCLTAIDMTIISTTLPTIVKDLPASSISGTWITSAFLLTQTAFQPMMGGLADVSGRRNALVLSVLLFMLGSTIAAVSDTMLTLVAGRGIQGIGGGGVQAISEIVLSDLTTLRERGIFVGFISLDFAVATFIAPLLGGYFSEHDWRWVFWINLPIGFVSLALIIPAMKLNRPAMPLRDKVQRMDIGANILLLGSVVAILVAVTNGGIVYSWSSWRIYMPFTVGCIGMAVFFAVELTDNSFSPNPVLPRRLFSNRTAGACFALTFLHGIVTYGLIYIIPIYFQSVKGASPIRSAIQLFPATAPSPFAAMAAGIIMVFTGKYKLQLWFWWIVVTLGCGLTILFDLDTPTWKWVVLEIIPGLGVGALFTITLPPIQASLPVDELAHATATFAFCRSFGSVWGIAIGTNVFVSVVARKLDDYPRFRELGLTGPTALGAVEQLGALPQDLVLPAREAYMYALRRAFISFVPVAGAGLLISFLVKDLPLPNFNESKHGINDVASQIKTPSDESHPMPKLTASQPSFTNLAATSQDTLIRLRAGEPYSEPLPARPSPLARRESRGPVDLAARLRRQGQD